MTRAYYQCNLCKRRVPLATYEKGEWRGVDHYQWSLYEHYRQKHPKVADQLIMHKHNVAIREIFTVVIDGEKVPDKRDEIVSAPYVVNQIERVPKGVKKAFSYWRVT